MDGYEAKELYYALIADVRPERRQQAAERLSGSPDGHVKKLAAIGQDVARVVHESADPKILEQAIKTLNTLPITDFWNGFSETAGQTILMKASTEKSKRATALREYGLKIIRMAQNAGFPLSDTSIGLVKKAKKEDERLRDVADDIVRLNASYSPEKEKLRLDKPPAKGKSRGKRHHT